MPKRFMFIDEDGSGHIGNSPSDAAANMETSLRNRIKVLEGILEYIATSQYITLRDAKARARAAIRPKP